MKKKHVELLQFLLHHATAVTSRQLAADQSGARFLHCEANHAGAFLPHGSV